MHTPGSVDVQFRPETRLGGSLQSKDGNRRKAAGGRFGSELETERMPRKYENPPWRRKSPTRGGGTRQFEERVLDPTHHRPRRHIRRPAWPTRRQTVREKTDEGSESPPHRSPVKAGSCPRFGYPSRDDGEVRSGDRERNRVRNSRRLRKCAEQRAWWWKEKEWFAAEERERKGSRS
jgi:hypothetical protein